MKSFGVVGIESEAGGGEVGVGVVESNGWPYCEVALVYDCKFR